MLWFQRSRVQYIKYAADDLMEGNCGCAPDCRLLNGLRAVLQTSLFGHRCLLSRLLVLTVIDCRRHLSFICWFVSSFRRPICFGVAETSHWEQWMSIDVHAKLLYEHPWGVHIVVLCASNGPGVSIGSYRAHISPHRTYLGHSLTCWPLARARFETVPDLRNFSSVPSPPNRSLYLALVAT